MKKLFIDSADGIVEHLIFDDAENRCIVQRQSDVEPNLDQNKREYNAGRTYMDGLGEKVASIPMGVVLTWLERYGVDVFNKNHRPAMIRLLRDPEWRHLRTSPMDF